MEFEKFSSDLKLRNHFNFGKLEQNKTELSTQDTNKVLPVLFVHGNCAGYRFHCLFFTNTTAKQEPCYLSTGLGDEELL